MAEIDKTKTTISAAQTRNNLKKPTTNSTIPKRTSNATTRTSTTRTANTKSTTNEPASRLPATKQQKISAGATATAAASSSNRSRTTTTTATKNSIVRTKPPPPVAAQNKGNMTKAIVSKRIASEIEPTAAHRRQNVTLEERSKKVTTKSNAVLNTPHNVTVTTPPMQRKSEETIAPSAVQNEFKAKPVVARTEPKKKVLRTGSRTLEPDEIVVLRRESAKKRFQEASHVQVHSEPPRTKSPIQPVVAFEVNFENPQEVQKDHAKSVSDTEYSDDCESSFSSHSTVASSSSGSASNDQQSEMGDNNGHTSDDDDTEEENTESDADEDSESVEEREDEEEESQVTPYPSTVIFKERRLDSGNYDINSQKNHHLRMSEPDNSSLDTISATRSEHFDSGISNYSNYAPPQHAGEQQTPRRWECCYSGYIDFVHRPIINRRGRDLLAKIRKFDEVTFGIFELKPISYEVYMLSYGNYNTTQSYAQTAEDNYLSRECQTDDYTERNMWTQHPPFFDRHIGINLTCGIDHVASTQLNASLGSSLIVPHYHHKSNKQIRSHRNPLNYETLNAFLLKSSLVLTQIFDEVTKKQISRQSLANNEIDSFTGYHHQHHQLNTHVLNALRVVRVFGSSRHNMVITVHESLPGAEVYSSDFSNLLMVWSSSNCANNSKPIRLLSTWSEVCRAEICYDCPDVLVCGLRDGSVALWNLQESHSYCSKLDGCLTHFAATHSVVPKYSLTDEFAVREQKLMDLGAAVDVKSFRSNSGISPSTLTNGIANKLIQFVSLHDNGLLTIWTLVRSNNSHAFNIESSSQPTAGNRNSRFEFSSPWAQMKLIQGATCDLRAYMERGTRLNVKTPYEKTRALFQRNISSDVARFELTTADMQAPATILTMTNLRFTALDAGVERIFVCSNRNFVLSCTRSLKWERINRIVINESRSLFLTAIRILRNEDFLAVGLANGAVVIVNCSSRMGTLKNVDHLHSDAKNLKKYQPTDTDLVEATADVRSPSIGNDYYPETAKSCAIQNIILNEKHNAAHSALIDFDPNQNRLAITTPHRGGSGRTPSHNKQKSAPALSAFERRICDQLLLLSGSDLRENLVQSLELTSNFERLFVLSNNRLRAYDFTRDMELKCDTNDSVSDLTTIRNGLVTLKKDIVHILYEIK